ncbi:motility-associated protein [Henriciella sp.]|uniref:motility-associated protein n=1 Tax=Henriciella sp. TaxID=1968823 RepID=UPI0026338337|nr:motility-associated protein [Henriciella sp.]
MTQIIGLLTVFIVVVGALAFSGSPAIAEALPVELGLIGGAAAGTLLIGNSPKIAGAAVKGIGQAMRGPKWTRQDYSDLLTGMHDLMRRARRGGFVAIEADIEEPLASPVFANRPKLTADEPAVSMITSSFRLLSLNPGGPSPIQAHLRDSISTVAENRHRAVAALNTLADTLPALGIVAAVLGIIKTMSAIDQSPDVIGPMIAAALLGTFLGVFLAYGLVGPIAARFGQVVDEEMQYMETIGTLISAHDSGMAPLTALEMARARLPVHLRPSLEEIDASISTVESLPRQKIGHTA